MQLSNTFSPLGFGGDGCGKNCSAECGGRDAVGDDPPKKNRRLPPFFLGSLFAKEKGGLLADGKETPCDKKPPSPPTPSLLSGGRQSWMLPRTEKERRRRSNK